MPTISMSAQEARELLSLQPGYERADLSSAYRRVVRSVHPDLLVGSSEQEVQDASDRLAQVNMANEVLQRALRINASGSWSGPESPVFAAPAAPAATSFTPASSPPLPASRQRGVAMIAVALGGAALAVAAFLAVVQLL